KSPTGPSLRVRSKAVFPAWPRPMQPARTSVTSSPSRRATSSTGSPSFPSPPVRPAPSSGGCPGTGEVGSPAGGVLTFGRGKRVATWPRAFFPAREVGGVWVLPHGGCGLCPLIGAWGAPPFSGTMVSVAGPLGPARELDGREERFSREPFIVVSETA